MNKIHDSMEIPPDIPIITGTNAVVKRRRNNSSESLSEALIGAATAVTKYNSCNTQVSTPTKNQLQGSGIGMGV